jgi:YVTN family beta-propeller protein
MPLRAGRAHFMSLTTMGRNLFRLRHLWILLALPLAAGTARIYVANSAGDSVQVVDPETNKVVQVIEGIEAPHGVSFSPDGSWVYISNESESVLNIVDRKTGKTIKKVPLSGHPNNIAVTKDGKRVLVCIADGAGALDVIDTTSLQRVKSIPAGGRLHNVYVTPDGKFAVAGSVPGKFVTVIDLQSEQPVWKIQFDKGIRPMAIESGPDGSTSRIFVELTDLNGFAVVDFTKRAEVGRVTLPDKPGGVSPPPGGSPSHGIGVAPDGKTLWVNSVPANSVFVYSLPELKLLGHVPLPELSLPGRSAIGASPNWVTFTPDSKTVYISDAALKLVSAIDMKTLKEVARIPVGEAPKRVNTLVLP